MPIGPRFFRHMARTYDVAVFSASGARIGGLQTISLVDLSGRKGLGVTGIRKAVQRFRLGFLTEAGLMFSRPDRGGGFLAAVRQSLIRTDIDVYQPFAVASTAILPSLGQDATADDPADEIVTAAALTGVFIAPGRLGGSRGKAVRNASAMS
jgi:hypothetical protein